MHVITELLLRFACWLRALFTYFSLALFIDEARFVGNSPKLLPKTERRHFTLATHGACAQDFPGKNVVLCDEPQKRIILRDYGAAMELLKTLERATSRCPLRDLPEVSFFEQGPGFVDDPQHKFLVTLLSRYRKSRYLETIPMDRLIREWLLQNKNQIVSAQALGDLTFGVMARVSFGPELKQELLDRFRSLRDLASSDVAVFECQWKEMLLTLRVQDTWPLFGISPESPFAQLSPNVDITVLMHTMSEAFLLSTDVPASSLAFALWFASLHASDRPDLCSSEAFLKEAARLQPVVSASPPELVTRSLVLSTIGLYIPQGWRVTVDVMQVNRDPTVFQNPDEFRLDRPSTFPPYEFGVSRNRVCPGRQVARKYVKAFFTQLGLLGFRPAVCGGGQEGPRFVQQGPMRICTERFEFLSSFHLQ